MENPAIVAQITSNAPIIILPVVIPDYQSQIIEVPITVKNFVNVQGATLGFFINPEALEFIEYVNGPYFPFTAYTSGDFNERIAIEGVNVETSIPDDTVVGVVKLRFISGNSTLTWDTTSWWQIGGVEVHPQPFEDYFINGEVHLIWSVIFNADADDATFGNSDGKIKMHICAREGEIPGAPIVPGNAPFTVKLKIDGNLVRTITDIPACEDYENMNFDPAAGPIAEVNCLIENLPSARYDLVVIDAVGNDARGFTTVFEVQPPYATLNGTVDPNGLETSVYFDFGLTTEYDRTASFGTVNGIDPVLCSMRLKSKTEGSSDPTEYLEEGTTYHYRIRATNSLGSSTGEDMTFTTPTYNAPPVAVTLPATNIG